MQGSMNQQEGFCVVTTIHYIRESQPADYENNKQLRHLLIQHSGGIPRKRINHRLVFPPSAQTPEAVDKIPATGILKVSSDLLCSEYPYEVHNRFCDECDLKISVTKYQASRSKGY
jgi:hypothetical protein